MQQLHLQPTRQRTPGSRKLWSRGLRNLRGGTCQADIGPCGITAMPHRAQKYPHPAPPFDGQPQPSKGMLRESIQPAQHDAGRSAAERLLERPQCFGGAVRLEDEQTPQIDSQIRHAGRKAFPVGIDHDHISRRLPGGDHPPDERRSTAAGLPQPFHKRSAADPPVRKHLIEAGQTARPDLSRGAGGGSGQLPT